ncbi:MAG: two-component regulator propeller domain-containing protein [Bacteroidales bacterium]
MQRYNKILHFALIAGLFFQSVMAQQFMFQFNHLTIDQGLSNNTIFDIYKDSKGFLWFATSDGLNKYDGYNFLVFRHRIDDSASISNNKTYCISEDSSGFLWVGTQAGLNRFDPHTGKFKRFFASPEKENSLSSNFIRTVYTDSKGRIWIGTFGGGLDLFEPVSQSFTHYPLNDNRVSSIIEDKEGHLWVGTEQPGINLVDPENNTFRFFPFPKGNANQKLLTGKKIRTDKQGNLWISTEGDGAYYFDLNSLSFKRFGYDPKKPSPGSNIIQDIYIDKSGNVWFATDGAGISVYNPKNNSFQHIRRDPAIPGSLSSNAVYDLFADAQNILWIGTFAGGINVLDPYKKQFYHLAQVPDNPKSLTHKSVLSFCEDNRDNIWIGTDGGGINIYKPHIGIVKAMTARPDVEGSLRSNSVTSLYFDHSGTIWAGTYAGGLNRYVGNFRFKTYQNNVSDTLSLINNNVWCLLEDKRGNFWIGTLEGLELMNRQNETFRHIKSHPEKKGLPVKVTALFEDSKGMIWVGGNGLGILDPLTLVYKPFTSNDRKALLLSNYDIRSITEDPQGNMWIGSEGAGLIKYSPLKDSLKFYTIQNGLPNDAVHQIVIDHHGILWLSTNHGICRFNPKTEEIRNFDISEGLQSNQFSYGASLFDKNGFIWFGGVNGLNFFHPDSIHFNKFIPPVYITELKMLNQADPNGVSGSPLTKNVFYTSKIILQYKSAFTLEFVSLNYTSSDKNLYTYMMEGFDTWSQPSGNRKATYTNLDPGTYHFCVKGSNNDGIWNPDVASIEVVILPPWWKSPWAYVAYITTIVLLLLAFRGYLISRQKMKHELLLKEVEKKKIEEVNQLKLQFFTNISHEFRSPLTLILGPLEKIMHTETIDESVRKQLKVTYRNASRLLRLINQILEFRKIETGNRRLRISRSDLVSFLKDIGGAFQDFISMHHMVFSIEAEPESIPAWFDREVLDKIFYNLLSNAFKFTPDGGSVSVYITISSDLPEDIAHIPSLQNGHIRIDIRDTGIGIPVDQKEKIFDRFYQISQKNKSINPHKIEGTGIGLALTRDLIHLHKGIILVSSEPGKGSCFTVFLPFDQNVYDNAQIDDNTEVFSSFANLEATTVLQAAESNQLTTNIENDQTIEKPIILVIDDNKDVREFIRNGLEKNYRILEAEDGNQGFTIALHQLPDLIISDVLMPETNGIILCENLKKHPHTEHIPVILLTARSAEEARLEGFLSGADEYISKPFSISFLEIRIANILNNRKKLWNRFRKELLMQPSELNVDHPDEVFLKKAMEVVEKHISDSSFDVKIFVKEMAMSRSVLYRRLEAVTGQSVNEFIKIIRLKRAAQLLTLNLYSVAEIAYEVGFNDPQYFSKCFRQYFHTTPSEYAANQKNIK